MKKLLILTAILTLTIGTLGCRCCGRLFRGAACNPCVPSATFGVPGPAYNPCDPCATGQTITPGPAPYSGIPAQ